MKKKEPKRHMSEEHRFKLKERYRLRQQAKERGIILPTRQQEREAIRAAKEPKTTQHINQLVTDIPTTEENARINTSEFFKPNVIVNEVRHPIKFRNTHDSIESLKR